MQHSNNTEEEFEAAIDFLVESRATGALSYLHDEALSALAKSLTCPLMRITGTRRDRVFWVLDVEELTWRQL
jgi:predicted subunit of tRNA(5-methylaminomethyl-2-thiouridylate) methyltransferase